MRRYLTFTLAAPLASFGTVAVGGRRTAAARPTKSQVLGLVAGALGIPRTAEEKLAALAADLGYAVRVEAAGIVETDYHTAQIPPTTRKHRFATRAEELAVPKHELATELSWREFHTASEARYVYGRSMKLRSPCTRSQTGSLIRSFRSISAARHSR